MEKIGVMAVVEELSKFQGDMGKVDSAIAGIIPTSSLLGSVLSGLGDIAKSAGGWIADTLANAVGKLLADAVEWATAKIKEMIDSAIEIGSKFQQLEIRLRQVNFNDFVDSGMDAASAMEAATKATEEQIIAIEKLAFKTPFEIEDITNVYSLARAYGYTDAQAMDLTETLADFVFGMGLTGEAATLVTKQFTQMTSAGKIQQRNLNALAADGVPVNKILDMMREKTGLAAGAFDEFKKTAGGVAMFKESFSEYIESNYAGAAEKANRSFKNASITAKEFFTTLLGGNVVKPILDILGEKIASMNDALQARLPEVLDGFNKIAVSIGDILTAVLGLTPSANSMADGFVNGLNGISDWLSAHKNDIVNWIKNTAAKVPIFIQSIQETIKKIGNWIDTYIIPAFNKITAWYDKNGNVIDIFFQSLGDIISTVFGNMTNINMGDDPLQGLLDGVTKFMNFVSENKDTIAFFIQLFITLSIIAGVVSAALGFVVSVVTSLAGTFIMFIGAAQVVVSIVGVIGNVFVWLGGILGSISIAAVAALAPFIALAVGIGWVAAMIYLHGSDMWNTIKQLGFLISYYLGVAEQTVKNWTVNTISSFILWGANIINSVSTTWDQLNWIISVYLGEIWNEIATMFNNVMQYVPSLNWRGIGWAIVDGMKQGVIGASIDFGKSVLSVVKTAFRETESYLGIRSPSKLFRGIGENTVLGFMEGIDSMSADAAKSMQGMVGGVVSIAANMPAMTSASAPSSVSNTVNNNNYNLNINSSASTEPIIQDFNLLASLQS